MTLPKITVLSLGGTIAMASSSGSGVVPKLSGEDLVSAVPQLAEVAEVSAYSFRQVPGAHLNLQDLVELAAEISRCVDEGAEGVVITQGTDTIEETAFALDLLVEVNSPLVVTGAMRNPTVPGADGPANLLAAVQVAASQAVRGLGSLVVFNDEIHAARYVQKTHTSNPATFRSSPVGPIGWISEGTPRVVVRPPDTPHFTLYGDARDAQVALLTVALGDEGRLLSVVEQLGYAGLVIEALGGGHVPEAMIETLSSLAKRMPIILASRTGRGEILSSTYGFPGSESDLIQRGLIPSGPLDGPKSRLLLSLLLLSNTTADQVGSSFDRWVQELFLY